MNKVSESIYERGKHDKISTMIEAMRGWETSLSSSMEKPNGQFGRVVKIATKSGLTLTNELDIEFDVPFDDDAESNEASITVYNLSNESIGMLKTDDEISITAGYGNDTGVIFTGVISYIDTKWRGQDKVTKITAIDDIERKEKDIESISYNAGVKASYVLKDLVGRLNLPLAVFKTVRDHTYSEAVTVSGGLMSNIKQYAEVCGVSAYINKRKIYVRHLSDGDDLGFEVNVDTGLLDSPEKFSEEIKNEYYTDTVNGTGFKMLLEHRITTASVISLKSRDFTGKYRVKEGRHVCNDADFYTEITAIVDFEVVFVEESETSTAEVKNTTIYSNPTTETPKLAGGGGFATMLIK